MNQNVCRCMPEAFSDVAVVLAAAIFATGFAGPAAAQPMPPNAEPSSMSFIDDNVDPRAAELLHEVLISPSETNLAVLADFYADAGFASASTFFELSATPCNPDPVRDQSASPDDPASLEQRKRLGEYSALYCSIWSGPPDTGHVLIERESYARILVAKVRELARADLAEGNSYLEQLLDSPETPSCHLVVEWASTELQLWLIGQDPAPDLLRLELALRSLIELRSRNYFPDSFATQTDLFAHLARGFFVGGNIPMSIGSARLALAVYPSEEKRAMGVVMPDTSPEDLERLTQDLCARQGGTVN